ncbi:lactonase family protein [Verrucomicrobium sp. BvORR106]|uniref:lactonase family protein n=1 Tax=Verrucomicrobium sp. BvORR106 TaxID=1403819 RepID=UPI00056F0AE7|nr:lactonase family protein [Verrucomicrobium sp. BvORR106]
MKLPRTLRLTALAALLPLASLSAAHDYLVYIGTYTGAKNAKVESKGIYVFGFDSQSGKLEPMGLAGEVKSPSFLAISPSKKYLYSVSEAPVGTAAPGKPATGGISSFSIDPSTGKLTLLNQESSQGSGPCHVSVDHTGKVVLVANYGSGHVASLPVKSDGSLDKAATVYLHEPASKANPKRQEGPHAHSINVDAANKFAFAADLGCDRVFIYKLDPAAGTITPNAPAFGTVPAGGGPRHFAFHPNGKYAYVCNEMTCTVTAFNYDAGRGALEEIATVSTLPEGTAVDPKFSTAETQVHPSGKFAYVSNRGHNTIAVYSVDAGTGKLKLVENAPSIVETPRNFGIDPSGKWLIAAGQSSSSLAVFAIDASSGKLTPTGQTLDVGSPVCVKFLSVK